jgi:hypothetical protein
MTYLFAAPLKKEHAQSGVLQALCFTYECVGRGCYIVLYISATA